MKLAVFEDLREPEAESPNTDPLAAIMPRGWTPMVRVLSRHNRESTRIYARGSGKQLELLIAACEPREMTLIEVKVSGKSLRDWLDDPEKMTRSSRHAQ